MFRTRMCGQTLLFIVIANGTIGFNPRRLQGPKRGMSSHATDLSMRNLLLLTYFGKDYGSSRFSSSSLVTRAAFAEVCALVNFILVCSSFHSIYERTCKEQTTTHNPSDAGGSFLDPFLGVDSRDLSEHTYSIRLPHNSVIDT